MLSCANNPKHLKSDGEIFPMAKPKVNPTESNNIEIRLIITPDDDLYEPFLKAKQDLGIKSHAEAARVLIKKGFEWFKPKL